MENLKVLKSRRRERLSSVSLSSNASVASFHSDAVHCALAPTLAATTDATSDDNISRSIAVTTRLARRCSLMLTLLLASCMFPLHQDYPPTTTAVLAAIQAHFPRKTAASHRLLRDEHASVGKATSGAKAKSAPRISPVDRHGTRFTETASSTNKGGLFGAAEVGGRRHASSPLPILMRQPYMTDHPAMTRFPLSVDADLTDDSFEAVEKASLEIARAVWQQQQKERSRKREEQYLSGELLRPSAATQTSYLSTTVAKGRLESEGVEGPTETPSRESITLSRHGTPYKVVESSATASSPQGGDRDSTWPDSKVEDYGEHETSAASQSATDTIGGRLIVGLTEITFPEMKQDIHRLKDPSSTKVTEAAHQTGAEVSVMREQSDGENHEQAGVGEGRRAGAGGTGGDAPEEDKDGGNPLSHEDAVREANQRLRLEHLQSLGIVKSVKVLENVGLVVLEFQNNLSVEEIRETVKTLWQRNRSTWLIEPDSDVVFRGRDSFERGDFVPVVPTEEEEAAGEERTEKTALASAQQAHAFLPGQEHEPEQHDQQKLIQQEASPRQSMRTSTGQNRSQVFNVYPREKDTVETRVAPRLHKLGDAAQIGRRTEDPDQRDKQRASEHIKVRSANNTIFEVSKRKAPEAAGSTKGRLPKVGEGREVHMNRARRNVSRTVTKRGLTLASSVPAVQPAQKRLHAYALSSGESLQAAKSGSDSEGDETHQQTKREATVFGTPSGITYDTAEGKEPDAGSLHTASHGPGTANDSSFVARFDIGRGIPEHATHPTTGNWRPLSLLKPHTGIVSLSLYDAAQGAVQEAIEEHVAFRSVTKSPSFSGRDECLEAFAACEKRHDFALEDAGEDTPYRASRHSSESTIATNSRSGAIARDEDPHAHAYTENGLFNQLVQTSNEQTTSEEQCKNQMETEAVETEVTDHKAPVSGRTGSEIPVGLPPEAPSGADEQQEAEEGAWGQEETLATVQENGSSQEQPKSSAQRRIIFAPSVVPVSEKHLPNDQYFSRQWAYHEPRLNVQAVEAWNLLYKHRLTSHPRRDGVYERSKPANHKNPTPAIATGKGEPIIVAVIDTGIDYTHEDLRTQMWTNEGEIPNNGIDDDGNGYVDDYYGYDFEKNAPDPMDYNGHGTHVAGIIGAAANNRRGITGVNWEVKLMPLKFTARSTAAAEAIDYSLRMGAQISTNSWGYASPSAGLKMAFQKTAAKGQLFVSAVDNAGKDNTYSPDYPPNWGYDKRTKQGARNILRVANLTAAGGVAGTSNFGPNNVDVVAPGSDIISTVPTRKFPEGYGYKTGTSMATPLVAGIAAMVWSAQPHLTAADVRDCIVRTSTRHRTLENFVIAGNVNAYAAVLDVLGPTKEPTLDTQKAKSKDSVPSANVHSIDAFSAAVLAALARNKVVHTQPAPSQLVKGNIFPSEEAFFQHIAQAQPYYAPMDVANYSHKRLKPSISVEAEDVPSTANVKAVPSEPNSLVSNVVSLLGPLQKLFFYE